jgi:hypothetical protein
MKGKSVKIFTVVWIGGEEERVEGVDIADAFRRAGIGGGALRAVDYFREEKDSLKNGKEQTK